MKTVAAVFLILIGSGSSLAGLLEDKAQELRLRREQEERNRRNKLVNDERVRQNLIKENLYSKDPQAFFARYVRGKWAINSDGSWIKPSEVAGRISQIVSSDLILLRLHGEELTLVAIRGYDSTRWVDDMAMSLTVQRAGTFRYESVMGAARTIPLYTAPRWVSFADFSRRCQTENLAYL